MQFIGLNLLCVLTFLLGVFCILIGASWCVASDQSRVSSRITRVGVTWGLSVLAAVLVPLEHAWTAAALVAIVMVYAFARHRMPRPQVGLVRVRLVRGLVALAGGCALVALSFASVWVWIPGYERWTQERDVAAVADHSVALIAAAREFQREHGRPPESIAELRSSIPLADETFDPPYGLVYRISPSLRGELELTASASRYFLGMCMYDPVIDDDSSAAQELAWDDDWEVRRGDWIFYDD